MSLKTNTSFMCPLNLTHEINIWARLKEKQVFFLPFNRSRQVTKFDYVIKCKTKSSHIIYIMKFKYH